MPGNCLICGLPLGDDGDCAEGHQDSLVRFHDVIRNVLSAMESTATSLRNLALRMDSRGELLSRQVQEQARRAEESISRIRRLLDKRAPRNPDESQDS